MRLHDFETCAVDDLTLPDTVPPEHYFCIFINQDERLRRQALFSLQDVQDYMHVLHDLFIIDWDDPYAIIRKVPDFLITLEAKTLEASLCYNLVGLNYAYCRADQKYQGVNQSQESYGLVSFSVARKHFDLRMRDKASEIRPAITRIANPALLH